MKKTREIKFRAWYPKRKLMYFVHWMWLQKGPCPGKKPTASGNRVGASDGMSGDFTNPKECILMQFTGLLDKNGKEIYEGDILEVNTSGYFVDEESDMSWEPKGSYSRGKVFWNEEHTQFVFGLAGLSGTNKELAGKSTIVGNIYENLELVEVK